eukprot:gnl/TRDRNA2_/TRDRNA2_193625_c0_seq1.p1 gnl/TRDRNA2_/TRDRNA2_193625_c0~~gnl/TRDRNA2_/TRDRNA2_193625_c0_seq1.p1  ORF type:complete len:193 (-),score=17.42 gnl/TRDRNA2_/TRDRNA2_193625_c0_seq1:103-624(-)
MADARTDRKTSYADEENMGSTVGPGGAPLGTPRVNGPDDLRKARMIRGVEMNVEAYGNASRAIWQLRRLQIQEGIPTGDSTTVESVVRGPEAREFSSFALLKAHKKKHVRSHHAPREQFLEPVAVSHEIGWHAGAEAAYTSSPRAHHPKGTCPMTRHMQNMYSTNAHHIIRRW